MTYDKEKRREYYLANRDRSLAMDKAYRKKNKEKESTRKKDYYKKTKDKYILKNKKYKKKCTEGWIEVFKDLTVCEICGKEISFNSGNRNTSIHFDHRHGGTAPISTSPAAFTNCRFPSEEHKATFKSCDFGILCKTCNGFLPTLNRTEWLENVTKYVNKI